MHFVISCFYSFAYETFGCHVCQIVPFMSQGLLPSRKERTQTQRECPSCQNLQLSLLYSTAPSSPPADFRGHNSSSTSIQIFWGDVPKPSVNGILLGFRATCERHNSSDRHFKVLGTGERHWEFKGLEKYMNYSCYVRAFNSFGNGNRSEKLVISTDEDGMLLIDFFFLYIFIVPFYASPRCLKIPIFYDYLCYACYVPIERLELVSFLEFITK